MCELAKVSRAGFYRQWLKKDPPEAEMHLRDAIQKAALANRYYGYRRIAAQLRQEGLEVSEKVARRLMREDQLLAIRRRKFVRLAGETDTFRIYTNLAQDLKVEGPNQLWVADFTYLRLGREFVFLAVVLDAWSRRVIGWQLGRHLTAELGVAALQKAIEARKPQPNLVHHSDQGSQYASKVYVKALQAIGAQCSMSHPGSPWENARCERFIGTLKREEIEARAYATAEELERHIEEFIEQIYNRRRLHSALGYRSPLQFEQQEAAQPGSEARWQPAPREYALSEEVICAPSN